MFRRTVIAEGYNSQVLFDIADNAAGTNWYRMGANHQIVGNKRTSRIADMIDEDYLPV